MTEAQGRTPALAVTITCEGDQTRIEIKDPLTDKRLERSIPSPPPSEPGSERVIALAASQLFVASWLELLVPRETPAAPPPEVRPMQKAAQALVRRRIATPAPRVVRVGVEGDVRVRDREAPFPTYGGAIRGGIGIASRVLGFARARFEAGVADRAIGIVDLRAVFVGLGASWEIVRFGALSLGASAVLSGGWMSLRPHALEGGEPVGSSESFTAEASLCAGPTFRVGRFAFSLEIEGGAMAQTPIGLVLGPQSSVQPGGPWAGLSLALSANL